jgi:hypothetical protein
MPRWDVGDTLVTRVTVTDEDNAPVDPSSIVLDWRWANDAQTITWTYGTDPQITRLDVGTYEAKIPLAKSGVLLFGWRSTAPAAAEQRKITVQPWRP